MRPFRIHTLTALFALALVLCVAGPASADPVDGGATPSSASGQVDPVDGGGVQSADPVDGGGVQADPVDGGGVQTDPVDGGGVSD